MNKERFELLPGMDEETFESWCERRKISENDLIFIFKAVKYNPEYIQEKITVKDVARRLNKPIRYVHLCLQQGRFPFGMAIKMPGSDRYNYVIYPEKFKAYCGEIERREVQ